MTCQQPTQVASKDLRVKCLDNLVSCFLACDRVRAALFLLDDDSSGAKSTLISSGQVDLEARREGMRREREGGGGRRGHRHMGVTVAREKGISLSSLVGRISGLLLDVTCKDVSRFLASTESLKDAGALFLIEKAKIIQQLEVLARGQGAGEANIIMDIFFSMDTRCLSYGESCSIIFSTNASAE